ncbi:MAG TPA: sigma 54-interacting transcriptional regulator [Vicinamibacterales bacterium]|nr:sigma 54-interacting transcriptional regulator [Vicinamibacterales bacterium]
MLQLLGASPALASVRDELTRLLARPAAPLKRLPPVLILGETGTGKGLVAHVIHQMGPRSDAAFVDLNCAAIPDTLLEAELFGYERGAFTDAKQAKAGLLQLAHRGTIFLDEIGLMPDALQAKLLKALEDHSVRRLGGTRAEPADAWVLAATSENLTAAIRTRRFREDLYHRLAVVTVQLPPLRERGGDVLLLARHYLDRACREYGLAIKTLSPDAESALLSYTWPGNVRELANLMERVALLSEAEQVTAAALRLPRAPRVPVSTRLGESVDEQMASLERGRIEEALRIEGGNISRAAARLGLPRNTLRYRMERHGLLSRDSGSGTRDSGTSARDAELEHATRLRSGGEGHVRWQRTRVTFLQAQALDGDGAVPEHERTRVLEEIAAKIAGFGGRIIELGTSLVRAAFGLEIVEDAARHAAHAALAVQRIAGGAHSQALEWRIALHTEEVPVGRLEDRVELAADARQAAQHVVDEMLAVAPAGRVLASASTKPFLERRFELEPLAATPEPKRAWSVVGLVDAERYVTPFVSRTREIALLEDLLTQVEEGRGQAVLLSGEPGIGKTRLLHEFRRRTRDRATWWQGAAVSFGSSLPFHPLIDLLKHAFSMQASDTDEVIGDRIDRATAAFGEAFRPSARFLRSLLSVEAGDSSHASLDPKLRRAGIFEAIGRFLQASSEVCPLIVVLEDLHWMDQATTEFLATMTESLASGRVLLCATQRAGYSLPLAQNLFGTQLTLSRVSRADASTIGCSLVGASTLSAELQQLVDEKTEGNPFFVEEVLRSLQEGGSIERRGSEVGLKHPTAKVDVPDSVRDVLLGRLARLDPASRDLLRVAAVIGREFPRRVLERVIGETPQPLEDRLRTLRSAELIHNTRVWPEVVYAFKHALIHEVAYDAQDEAERRSEHARIGEAVEQAYSDRVSEHFGVLAHHFTQAQRWHKSLEYLLAAAQQAERNFASREALALYDEALRAAERLSGGGGDPRTLIKIHQAKTHLYAVTSEFERSAAEGQRILPLARLIGDRTTEADALAAIAWASFWGRNLDGAVRYSREALAVGEPAGALAAQGRAHFTLGFLRSATGVIDEGQAGLERATAISRAAGDAVHESLSLSTAGLVRNWFGDFHEADRLQAQAMTLARERDLLVPTLFGCFMRGLTLTGKGDYDGAFALLTEGMSLAERVGDEAVHHRLLNCLGWVFAELGDLDESEALNARSAVIGRRRSDPGTSPNAELNLGEVFTARGELARAQDRFDTIFRYYKDPSSSLWMRFRYSIRMFAGMGELAVAQGDFRAARAYSAECLDLAIRAAARKNLVKAWRLAGKIAHADGDRDTAEGHFRKSRDLAVSLGNPVQQWKTELALGHFLRETGRPDDARHAYERALAVMDRVREGLRHERLKDAFAKNSDYRQLQDLVAGV